MFAYRDVKEPIIIFDDLIKQNVTIIIIEYNVDLIKNSDYIIDLRPGGGIDGGQIVATDTLDDIINNENSITGKYLK